MMYSININQKAIAENFPELDLKDAAILAYLIKFSHSKKIKKITIKEKDYYWFKYSHLIKDLPLLKIKTKDAIYRRFRRLCKYHILLACPENQEKGMSYYGFGENYDCVIDSSAEIKVGLPTDEKPKVEVRTENLRGTDEKSEVNTEVRIENRRGTDEKPEPFNPSTNNPSTNINPITTPTSKEGVGELEKKDLEIERLKKALKEKRNENPPIPLTPLKPKRHPIHQAFQVSGNDHQTYREVVDEFNDELGLKGNERYSPSAGAKAIARKLKKDLSEFTIEDVRLYFLYRAHTENRASPNTMLGNLPNQINEARQYFKLKPLLVKWQETYLEVTGSNYYQKPTDHKHIISLQRLMREKKGLGKGEDLTQEKYLVGIDFLVRKAYSYFEGDESKVNPYDVKNNFAKILSGKTKTTKHSPGTRGLDPVAEAYRRSQWG